MYNRSRPDRSGDARARAEVAEAQLTRVPSSRAHETGLPADHPAVVQAERYHAENNYQTIPTFTPDQRHQIESNYQTIPDLGGTPRAKVGGAQRRPMRDGAPQQQAESQYGRWNDVRALLEAQGRLAKSEPSAQTAGVAAPRLDDVLKARDKAYSSEGRSRGNGVPYTRIAGDKRQDGVATQGFRTEGKVSYDRASDTFRHSYGPATYEFKVNDVVGRLAPGNDGRQLRSLIEQNGNITLQNGTHGMTFEDRSKTIAQPSHRDLTRHR